MLYTYLVVRKSVMQIINSEFKCQTMHMITEHWEKESDTEGERVEDKASSKLETILEITSQTNTVLLTWKLRFKGRVDFPQHHTANPWLSCE